VQVGSSATATLTISNTGNAALSVSGISASGAGLSTVLFSDWSSGTVAPGASQQVTIQFAPAAAQAYSGNVVVSSDATGGTNTVPVAGTGTQAPPASGPAPLAGYYVYGGPGYTQYLGFFTCISCAEYYSDSINNDVGRYGSRVSPTSIKNHVSQYGSAVGPYSACNEIAANPPKVYDATGTIYYGQLTLNQIRSDGIKDADVVNWLKNDVCKG
jgi:hypothetical protein